LSRGLPPWLWVGAANCNSVETPLYNPRRLGALPLDGATSFRVWAPHASAVAVIGEFNNWDWRANPLKPGDDGIWSGEIDKAHVGQQYQFYLQNGDQRLKKNDPYAREIHPKGRRSVIYDDSRFQWKSPDNVLPNWNDLTLYELHVGTFRAARGGGGTFDQVIERLPYLKNLGINALEIMPPMSFPSETSWGYAMTNPFAIETSYGGPDAFKRLVDAAHQQGIGIVLDVVINHFGPDDLDLWQFDGWSENGKGGIYFYNDHRAWTPWGENRPDFGRGEVRQYLRDSVMVWLEQFHVDGLRFDATLFVRNSRGENNQPEHDLPDGWTLMQWINREVKDNFPKTLLIAEDIQRNEWVTKPIADGGLGYDSQWDPAFIHPLRSAIVAVEDRDRSMHDVVEAILYRYNNDAIQRVIYCESHDSVANGQARLPQEIQPDDSGSYYARKRSTLAAGILFTSPGIPMLFEGQEILESGWFRDTVPVDWSKLNAFRGINRLYRDLIHLRRDSFGNTKGLLGPYATVYHRNDNDKIVAFHRWMDHGVKDDVIVVASFTSQSFDNGYRVGLPAPGRWIIRLNSDWKGYSPDFDGVGDDQGFVVAEKEARDGFEFTGEVPLAPYGFLILSQEETEEDAPKEEEQPAQTKQPDSAT
jgi:1,4-alpha-glucan branching enzyme